MNGKAEQKSLVRTRHLYLVPDRKIQRAKYVPAGRALHLIDLENLMGGPFGGRNILRATSDAFRETAQLKPGDHVIVGVNPALALEAGLAWPQALLVRGAGPDGADLALLDQVADVARVGERFDRVVIGSGDGIFSSTAAALQDLGVSVGVVSREDGCSYRLARSVSCLRFLPLFDTPRLVS